MAPRMERFKRPSLEDCEDRISEVFFQLSGGVCLPSLVVSTQ